MASSGSNNPHKGKIWDDTPVTFTEFGALSSDLKPSGGFFSRLWKKNKDDEEQFSSTPSLVEDSYISRDESRAGSLPPNTTTVSRQSSSASSSVSTREPSEDGDHESTSGQVPPRRSLNSVLSRLTSILDQRSSTPQIYKDSDFKQYWMPDSSCKECYDCGDRFTTFKRRHHCRICGQIFCSKCCNQELPGKIIGYKGGIRVCAYCCRVVQKYAHRSASTGEAGALNELRSMSQIDNESFEFGVHRSVSPRLASTTDDLSPQFRGEKVLDLPGLKALDSTTPFDLTPLSEFSSQESLLYESKLLFQDSLQLKQLWHQIFDPEVGLETQTLRIRLKTYQNCIIGKELVDWLLKNDKAATRDQALAIGQALIYAKYLESVGNQTSVFKDDFTALYRPGETTLTSDSRGISEVVPATKLKPATKEPKWFLEITKSNDDEDDECDSSLQPLGSNNSEALLTNQSSESESRTVFYVSETSRSGSFSEMPKPMTLMSRDMIEEPLPRQDSSVIGLGDEFLKGALFMGKAPVPSSDVITCPHGWRVAEQLREENGEKLAYERLKKAHSEHWQAMIRQLLGQYNLLLGWETVVSNCISQVSHFVRPDVQLEGDDMDIRQYVHIKKVPGGNKNDTSMFHGVIFTKNIAHKKMKSKVTNPLILLLRGTIEFQRVEQKFSSLEPQILQEREFMKNCVMKMIAYRPNVVVVEKSVSRLAQEFLLEAGITLLYNVKLSVMERLARFTQAHIVPSIDGLVSKPNLGFCHDFRVQTYTLPNKETKTLAIFDGCATHLGCTIVLRGGSLSELHKVKRIVKFMTYTSYNSLLELCYCMDEFALPKPGIDEVGTPFEQMEEDKVERSCPSKKAIKLEPVTKNRSETLNIEEDKDFNIEIVSIVKKDDMSIKKTVVDSMPSYDTFTPELYSQLSQSEINPHLNDGEAVSQMLTELSTSPGTRESLHEDVSMIHGIDNDKTLPSFNIQSEQHKEDSNIVGFEKERHYSGLSVASTFDTLSGRSTPELHSVSNARELSWTDTPTLIGNIICVIPASAVPLKETLTESDEGKQSGSDVKEFINEDEVTSNCNKSDLRTDIQKPISPIDCENSTIIDRNFYPPAKSIKGNTSKLTELTDFSDPLLGYQNTQDESIFSSTNTNKISLKEIKQTKYKRFRKALDGVHLSVSPYHKYTVPFIETDRGARCAVRKYLPEEIFWSSLFEGERNQRSTKGKTVDMESIKPVIKSNIEILNSHSFVTSSLTEPIWENSMQSILADFRARGGRINLIRNREHREQLTGTDFQENKRDDIFDPEANLAPIWEKKLDCLDPMNHQRLMVLFSSFSYKSNNHPYPCVQPWVVTMEFYGRNDITLGGFLERFCFREQYHCPSNQCDTPMTDHVRRFVHGTACINVLLKKLDSDVPGGSDNILMWSWCRKCKQVTPVVPISGDTWSLSFAKYIDLRFHSSSFLRRGSAEQCPHSLHHDHFQYFGHKNIVASFKFANISMKGLALPASTVTIKPPTFDSVALIDAVRRISNKAIDRYSMILESTMKLKQELTSENQIKIITDFLTEQQQDKKNFKDAATNIQMKVKELISSAQRLINSEHKDHDLTFHLYSIFDNTELLKRHICEDVIKWNSRMQEFMINQQKKSKIQTSSKKDKDITAQPINEETEKMLKTSKTPIYSMSLTVQAPSSSSPVSQLDSSQKVSHFNSLNNRTVNNSPLAGSSHKEEDTDSLSASPKPDSSLVASSLCSDASTSQDLHHANPSPQDRLISSTSVPSQPVDTDHSGAEDSADSIFQDLKGFTRRLLSSQTFSPLALPFDLNEHHTLPLCERVPIVVNDNEPSSIIAYSLSSSDYLCRLREIQTASRPASADPSTANSLLSKSKRMGKPDSSDIQTSSDLDSGKKSSVLSFLRGSSREVNLQLPTDIKESIDSLCNLPGEFQEEHFRTSESSDGLDEPVTSPDIRSGYPSPHIELQFTDTTAKFYCRVYFADQFRKLRKLIFPGSDNLFIRSLSRCKAWEAKGGKSGSAFSKTVDDRFILKQMSNMEVESFEKFAPHYFKYIKTCINEQQPTSLAKILGVYRIGFRNSQTNQALRQDVLVMENLFYNRKITQKFDLKGSMRNRLVNTTSKRAEEELVLLDENLLKSSVESPLYLRPHSKLVLRSAITSDSSFLSTNLVMDYSLLVGIDDDTQELVVGIIDYIRTFTWDKKLEMVVKSTGILGGQGKMPTVVSPQLYKGRFLEAMDRYFLQVPDRWMGLGKESPKQTSKIEDEKKDTRHR